MIRYMRFDCRRPEFKNAIEDIAYTFHTRLDRTDVDILSDMSKTNRYEIRRSEKDNLVIHHYDSDELKDKHELLVDFQETYNHFCELCGNYDLKKVFDAELIQLYIANGCFALSEALFCNGKVFHAYFLGRTSVCLWYSASDFRNENVDKNLAARANKRLHFEDMKYFRGKGFTCYDWGNVSSRNNENPNGIDRFKESFGGRYIEMYSYTVGNSALGKILVKLKKLRR